MRDLVPFRAVVAQNEGLLHSLDRLSEWQPTKKQVQSVNSECHPYSDNIDNTDHEGARGRTLAGILNSLLHHTCGAYVC